MRRTRTPDVESSTTTHWLVSTPIFSAASRNISGSGFLGEGEGECEGECEGEWEVRVDLQLLGASFPLFCEVECTAWVGERGKCLTGGECVSKGERECVSKDEC